MFFCSSASLIGLDIQPDAIRLLQLLFTKKGWRINQFATETPATTLFKDGKNRGLAILDAVIVAACQAIKY